MPAYPVISKTGKFGILSRAASASCRPFKPGNPTSVIRKIDRRAGLNLPEPFGPSVAWVTMQPLSSSTSTSLTTDVDLVLNEQDFQTLNFL